jgi:hypothetical protein
VDLHETGEGGYFVLCPSESCFRHTDLTQKHEVTNGLSVVVFKDREKLIIILLFESKAGRIREFSCKNSA